MEGIMTKKNFWKILACCAIAGAAIAIGIAYFTKYRSFQKSLEEDFDDFEDDFDEEEPIFEKEDNQAEDNRKREYVSIPLD